jgi:hypothetical protein
MWRKPPSAVQRAQFASECRQSPRFVILRSGATKNLLFAGAKRKQISRSARNDNGYEVRTP